MRDTLTGYLVPGHVGDGAWMAWKKYSAAVVVAAVAPWGEEEEKKNKKNKNKTKNTPSEYAF